MTNYDSNYVHPFTYEATDDNNNSYLYETQYDDCDDQFDDNDF